MCILRADYNSSFWALTNAYSFGLMKDGKCMTDDKVCVSMAQDKELQ